MPQASNQRPDFPESLQAETFEQLDQNSELLRGTDSKVRDIIVFGPTLVNQQNKNRPWTIGMRGYRRSHVDSAAGTQDLISNSEATNFIIEYIDEFRNERHQTKMNVVNVRPTSMDVDIMVPTLLVVVSPTPLLHFQDIPISAKVDFRNRAFGRIDQYCKKPPRLWRHWKPNDTKWVDSGPTVLTWISEYDHMSKPRSTESHDYRMSFKSVSFNSLGKPYNKKSALPIIFDPSNNNGGIGGSGTPRP